MPDGLEEAFPIEVGMASYLGVPIISTSGTILGHLVIIDEKPMKYGAADQPILEIFAQRAAAEIERQRAEEKLRQLNRELEITNRTLEARVQARTQTFERRRQVAEGLHEVLLLLNMSKPVEAIIRFIAQQAKQLLAADAVAICRRATDRRINLEGTINLTSPSGGKPFNFASKLIISERTVGNHIGRILAKLHLANRTQAALYALRRGLASFDDI